MDGLRVLVAPSGFKECLTAETVAAAIARGVRRANPLAAIVELPVADGGEGFAVTLASATGGTLKTTRVTGPLGQPVDAVWSVLGGNFAETAVIDMASAAGLSLVPRDRRDPLTTTTYGVGELIRAALDAGIRHIVFGCGDSGTNDGGTGMASALGARFLDARGNPIEPSGRGLLALDRINLSDIDPRLAETRIEVACNIRNLLCGPKGVAQVYGPQKGASPAQVELLAQALDRFAGAVEQATGIDVTLRPGCGASGGLGAGLHALLGARLHPRYDLVARYLDLDAQLAAADLVLTAEGGLDGQSGEGKIPGELGMRAQKLGIPVIALAGTIGLRADTLRRHGIGAYFSTVMTPCSLRVAMAGAEDHIEACAENVMRTVMLSMGIATRGHRAPALRAA